MFWERFESLCNESKRKPNRVAAETGISSASITKWKRGTIPNPDSLGKIAEYFCVSIDYLLGKTDQKIDDKTKCNVSVNLQLENDGNGKAARPMALSENLKKLRERAGMTQAELAEAIGVAQPTLAQYETGLKVPSIITAVKIEQVLHTTCSELVGKEH